MFCRYTKLQITLSLSKAVVVLGCLLVYNVEAKRRGTTHYEEDTTQDRFDEIYTIVKNIYLILLAPVVLKFLYSILTDPALPGILKAFVQSIRREVTRYIAAEQDME